MTQQIIPQTQLQLMIVADNLLTRMGLVSLLEDRGCMIAGQSDGATLNHDIEIFRPDILLIDMGWHNEPMRQRLSSIDTDLPILALVTSDDSDDTLLPLIQLLASFSNYGLLLRDSDPDTILVALNALDNGLLVIDPALSSLINMPINRDISPLATPLTPRENEVLQLLALGMTNKAIALQLNITQHTVKFHVNAIMTKLDAQSRTQAVVRATQLGMILL
jgi:two-component system, NarL family, nitrate/nitrite response regulator NarL